MHSFFHCYNIRKSLYLLIFDALGPILIFKTGRYGLCGEGWSRENG